MRIEWCHRCEAPSPVPDMWQGFRRQQLLAPSPNLCPLRPPRLLERASLCVNSPSSVTRGTTKECGGTVGQQRFCLARAGEGSQSGTGTGQPPSPGGTLSQPLSPYIPATILGGGYDYPHVTGQETEAFHRLVIWYRITQFVSGRAGSHTCPFLLAGRR